MRLYGLTMVSGRVLNVVANQYGVIGVHYDDTMNVDTMLEFTDEDGQLIGWFKFEEVAGIDIKEGR